MSYNKTTWNTGDVITAEKLNNMENGIKNANDNFITIEVSNISDIPEEDDSYACETSLSLADILSIDDYASKIYVLKSVYLSDSLICTISTDFGGDTIGSVSIVSSFIETARDEYATTTLILTTTGAYISFNNYNMRSLRIT